MKSFEQISEDAAKIIATWPDWKQRTLMVQNEAKCKEREPVKQTDTDTLVQALRLLASDIHCCEEDVVTSVIREAADKIAQFHVALKTLSTWAETAEKNQINAKHVLYVTEDCLGRSAG